MFDIVIISVPGISANLPPAAPALLKATVEQAGFTCRTLDFNLRLYQQHHLDIPALSTYYSTGLNNEQEELAKSLVDSWCQELAKINANYIGISVFTQQSRIATRMFCEGLRKYCSSKIVLGGQGLSNGGIGGDSGFGREMQSLGLADYYIRSEGEISLVELLKGNTQHPGICSDTFVQVDDLDLLPLPDYSDYELNEYAIVELPVTGSRGCVRSCSFCDIHEHWKFRYRSGEGLAKELMHMHQRYGVSDFRFTDSLVNGNLREFKKFIRDLANYNQTQTQKIRWSGQFIVRAETGLNDDYWQLIAESGGNSLAIGVETGSDRVRTHMNKRFTNKDLDYTMARLDQYNITSVFLMIVGYPTETDEDFEDTLEMFTRYQSYANRIIRNVSIGSTLAILPGTPLYHQADELGIELDKYENNWISLDNPELTLPKRLQRRQQLFDHLTALGYSNPKDPTEHAVKILEKNQEMFEKRLTVKRLYRIRQDSQRTQENL
jgi:radical SAM superfamily enzyme YgiQ (UPF0313 family)